MRRAVMQLLVAMALGAASAMAAVPASINPVTPGQINYQGRLKSAEGTAYTNGVYTMEFRLYDSQSSTDSLWAEEHTVYVKNGYFSVMLGSSAGTEIAGATHSELWSALWYDSAGARLTDWPGLRFVSITFAPLLFHACRRGGQNRTASLTSPYRLLRAYPVISAHV